MFLPSPVKSGGMAYACKLLLAAAALLAGAPAFAESPTVSSADFAKSEAIIGAPSALAAILAEQGAPRRVTVPVQPASYGIGDISYEIRDAVIRTPPVTAPPASSPVAGRGAEHPARGGAGRGA